MSNNPKFSVVVPAYNVAEYIQECLDSIYAQNIKDFEIIVVNDCSTDSTRRILDEQTDQRLIVVNHDVNKGLSSARNTGIAHAKGEFVAFIDSDDAWLPYHLKLAEMFFTEHPDINWYASDTYSIPEFGADFYKKKLSTNISFLVLDYFKDRKGGIMQFLPSSTVMRRVAILTDELFPTSTRYHEDLTGWLNFGINSPTVGRSREKTVLYRLKRPGAIMSSLSNNIYSKALAIAQVNTYLSDKIQENTPRYIKKYIFRVLFSINFRLIVDSVSSQNLKQIIYKDSKLPYFLRILMTIILFPVTVYAILLDAPYRFILLLRTIKLK